MLSENVYIEIVYKIELDSTFQQLRTGGVLSQEPLLLFGVKVVFQ